MTKDISPWKDREKISDLPKIAAFDWLENYLKKHNCVKSFTMYCLKLGDDYCFLCSSGLVHHSLLEAIQAEVKKDAQD